MSTKLQQAANLPHVGKTVAADEELMQRYRVGNGHSAIDELIHRYERELYNYLARYLRDRDLAEEAFQSTFLRLHQKRQHYTTGRRFRPWLYSIATHQAIDLLRRRRTRQTVSLDAAQYPSPGAGPTSLVHLLQSDLPSPLEQAAAHERRAWARTALDALPEYLRVSVLLVYFQGLSYREAAESLEIPLGTIKSRLHTALVKLNEAWRREHPGAEE